MREKTKSIPVMSPLNDTPDGKHNSNNNKKRETVPADPYKLRNPSKPILGTSSNSGSTTSLTKGLTSTESVSSATERKSKTKAELFPGVTERKNRNSIRKKIKKRTSRSFKDDEENMSDNDNGGGGGSGGGGGGSSNNESNNHSDSELSINGTTSEVSKEGDKNADLNQMISNNSTKLTEVSLENDDNNKIKRSDTDISKISHRDSQGFSLSALKPTFLRKSESLPFETRDEASATGAVGDAKNKKRSTYTMSVSKSKHFASKSLRRKSQDANSTLEEEPQESTTNPGQRHTRKGAGNKRNTLRFRGRKPSGEDTGSVFLGLVSTSQEAHELKGSKHINDLTREESMVLDHFAYAEAKSAMCIEMKDLLKIKKYERDEEEHNKRVKGFFGLPLETVLANDRITNNLETTPKVPLFIEQCCDQFYKNEELACANGVFRVSKGARNVKANQKELNSNGTIDVSKLSAFDMANLMKIYLRELPEPLLTFELYNAFLKTYDYCEVPDLQVMVLQRLLYILPTTNRQLVFYLLKFFRYISGFSNGTYEGKEAENEKAAEIPDVSESKSSESASTGNKMDAKNLGVVVGPNLLRAKNQKELSFEECEKVGKITEVLIENEAMLCQVSGQLLLKIEHNMDLLEWVESK